MPDTSPSPAKASLARGIAYQILSMVFITIGASLAKLIFPVIGAENTTMLRLSLATLLLWCMWHPWRHPPKDKKAWFYIALYGATLGVMNFLFYLAVERIPLGIAIALEFMGPLSLALFKSRHFLDILWFLFAAMGVALLLLTKNLSLNVDILGVLFALGAAVCWAIYIITGKMAGEDRHAGSTVAWGTAIGALLIAPFIFLTNDPIIFTPKVILVVLGVGLFSSALPHSLEMIALRIVPSKLYGILTSLGPIIGAFAGIIFLSESLTLLQWFGIISIVIASTGSTLFYKKQSASL